MSWAETVDKLNILIPQQCDVMKKLAKKLGIEDFEIECPERIEFSPEAEMSLPMKSKYNGTGK